MQKQKIIREITKKTRLLEKKMSHSVVGHWKIYRFLRRLDDFFFVDFFVVFLRALARRLLAATLNTSFPVFSLEKTEL